MNRAERRAQEAAARRGARQTMKCYCEWGHGKFLPEQGIPSVDFQVVLIMAVLGAKHTWVESRMIDFAFVMNSREGVTNRGVACHAEVHKNRGIDLTAANLLALANERGATGIAFVGDSVVGPDRKRVLVVDAWDNGKCQAFMIPLKDLAAVDPDLVVRTDWIQKFYLQDTPVVLPDVFSHEPEMAV